MHAAEPACSVLYSVTRECTHDSQRTAQLRHNHQGREGGRKQKHEATQECALHFLYVVRGTTLGCRVFATRGVVVNTTLLSDVKQAWSQTCGVTVLHLEFPERL